MDVFVNDIASFLPNNVVTNDNIEEVLGRVDGVSSRTRRIVLKNNQILQRYYAIDPETGRPTHTNAQLTAQAVGRLNPYPGFHTNDIQCLACGTSTPDLLIPGHALMVAGELKLDRCDAVTTSGICICGMTAFKYAHMNVAMGYSDNAVATGSEIASSFTRAGFFSESVTGDMDIEDHPEKAFDADFLRWMLSDGSGAVFLSRRKNRDRLSLKVDWIENISFAGELETCMYSGGVKQDDGTVTGWRSTEAIQASQRKHLFAIRQDIKLLGKQIVQTAINQALVKVIEKHQLSPEMIDWFLPHYSSHFFRDKFFSAMQDIGFEIPYDKWFTNLYTKGNTGSAAIYIILEELFHSEKLRKGDRLLCFIPESGRFSHCYMGMTVV